MIRRIFLGHSGEVLNKSVWIFSIKSGVYGATFQNQHIWLIIKY